MAGGSPSPFTSYTHAIRLKFKVKLLHKKNNNKCNSNQARCQLCKMPENKHQYLAHVFVYGDAINIPTGDGYDRNTFGEIVFK